MNSNISIVVVIAIIVLILLVPHAAQNGTKAKAIDKEQFVPATGSIK